MEELKELPAVQELEKKEKRKPEKPDLGFLTDEQREGFYELLEFTQSNERYAILEGYAGTGKTTLVSVLIEHLLTQTGKVLKVTAPTNKAVKVLEDSGSIEHNLLSYSTIHKIMNIKGRVDGYGKEVFYQYEPPIASKFGNIIFIDESSMISNDLLLGTKKFVGLLELAVNIGFKIIFIGDPMQIPAVGLQDSIPFTQSYRDAYNMRVVTLGNIVRQAQDNPIIATTMDIRKRIGADIVLPLRKNKYDSNYDGVFYYDKPSEVVSIMEAYFCSDNFKSNPDFCKVLCWTNKAVDKYNKSIRKMVYGNDAGKICIGEKLVANRIIKDPNDDEIIFNNNDEFEVVSYKVVEGAYRSFDLTYYEVRVRDIKGAERTIKIIHEDSDSDYKLVLDYYVMLAKKERKGTYQAAREWKKFYAIQEVFADVKYNYAITAHKSQGSTYRNVFIIQSDIDKNFKLRERNRIKYTACTRPSHRLFIVG